MNDVIRPNGSRGAGGNQRLPGVVSPWRALRADAYRQTGSLSIMATIRAALLVRTFRPVATMRLCQAAREGKGLPKLTLPLFKVLHRVATQLAGIDFSWETRVGPGFKITHGWGLVISPEAVIGSEVTLFHGVTLGKRERIAEDGSRIGGYPELADEVWVGPHAIIVGAVVIGRGSRIGGGAFVSESVPAASIVSGNPAGIVKSNCVPDVLNPVPKDLRLD